MSKNNLVIISGIIVFGLFFFILFTAKTNEYTNVNSNSNVTKSCNFNETATSLTINFNTCTECVGITHVGFGSTSYNFLGIKDNFCVFNFGGEVENPNWDGELDTRCEVPNHIGEITFQVTNYGVNFSSISEYCN